MKTTSLSFLNLQHTPLGLALLGAYAAGLGSLSGCTVGPDYQRPSQALPETYLVKTANPDAKVTSEVNRNYMVESQKLVEGRNIPAEWWELFHNQSLNELVAASLKNNPTIEAAQAALRGAKETTAAQEAAFFRAYQHRTPPLVNG